MIVQNKLSKRNVIQTTAADNGNSSSGVQIAAPLKKHNFLYYLRRDYALYIMLIIPVVYIVIFKYISMVGIAVAFEDYSIFRGIFGSPWNNFATFVTIFKSQDFYQSVKNTLVLNLLDLVAGFPAPIILAILIDELVGVKFKKLSQTILYLPHFLSWVIIGGITNQVFGYYGLANTLLKNLGGTPQQFLTNNVSWVIIYVLIGIWQSAGWETILYLAAITGIDQELYEAADVDGAGRFAKIWHITLPGIKPTICILLILQLGRIMAVGFDRPYILQNSMVMDVADVISTYVYRVGIQSSNFSIGAAFGLANMWEAVFGDVGVTIIAILNAIRATQGKDL